MTIEELKDKHAETPSSIVDFIDHTKLSIEFAIGVLEEINDDKSELDTVDLVWAKLMMLRQQINN